MIEDDDGCIEEKSISDEEFSILGELFDRADVEADVEGDSLTLRAHLDDGEQRRFARLKLLPFAHQLAHRVLATGGEHEMLTLIGLFDRMKGILSEYLETDDLSSVVEVVAEEQLSQELVDYRSFSSSDQN
ncbi:MAG: hypothetical protein EBU88_00800 [Acidobacteria bacterium]|nr:hypothetical protein [Acidobacteriota bacterium]